MALVDMGGAPELRVELRRADANSFRRVGSWGLSPVGNFADWNRVAAPVRDRFDRLTACVGADESFARGFGASGRRSLRVMVRSEQTATNSVPWLLLGALACVIATLQSRWRLPAWRRRAAIGAGLALGTLALRSSLLPGLFFHQNGQGPLWISVLVSPQYHPYGPGYRAVFGWLRWLTRDPERGVFFVQAVLACLTPACAAFVARRLGARRPVAYALALALALDPILGRLSRSESYYGLGASLLFIASALLVLANTASRMRSAGFLLPVVAAALVIAQHALVHPVGWLAAALSPAALLLAPGHWRRRSRRLLAATAIIAVIVAVTAAPSMLATLRSPFGGQWTGGGARGFAGIDRLWRSMPIVLLAMAVAACSARSWRRGALHALVLLVALSALLVADLVGFGQTMAWVHQAYLRLYAPAAVALAAAVLGRLPRSRAQALAVAALAVLVSWRAWPAWTRVPTDAREQALAHRWRAELPSTARVAYLERAGRRVLVLPFYRDAPRVGPSPLVLRSDAAAEELDLQGIQMFYERTSLCSTPEGRELCAQVEGRYRLETVHEASLPAIPSMVGLGYETPLVRVGLYRVAGRTQGSR